MPETKKSIPIIWPIAVILFILTIDQILKIIVKTHMTLGESSYMSWDWWNIKWFQIKFIENPGMALGIDLPWRFGKMTLSLFRIIAICGITWYMIGLFKKNAHPGLIICLSVILAGAIGNIIDSVMYGVLFSESTYTTVSEFLPAGGGYAPLLHGQVVDMLYFPVIDTYLPDWFPVWGGKSFVFFRPIFNIADSSISVGVIAILLFQKRFFKDKKPS
jgi:signal peptidase II